MVGLYLRSQGEFVLWRAADGSGGPTANEWLYYQIGAIELLPELWRWSGVRDATSQHGALEALSGLAGALLPSQTTGHITARRRREDEAEICTQSTRRYARFINDKSRADR